MQILSTRSPVAKVLEYALTAFRVSWIWLCPEMQDGLWLISASVLLWLAIMIPAVPDCIAIAATVTQLPLLAG